jgi:hypothetical protein
VLIKKCVSGEGGEKDAELVTPLAYEHPWWKSSQCGISSSLVEVAVAKLRTVLFGDYGAAPKYHYAGGACILQNRPRDYF